MVLNAKNAALLVGVFQQASLVLIIRYSKTRSDKQVYLTSVAVWSAELLKIFLNLILEIIKKRNDSKASNKSINELAENEAKRGIENSNSNTINGIFNTLCTPESFKLILPAFLYVVQNNLLFFALSNLSVPVYQVTNQGKLLTTALISRILLKKKISSMQYVALAMLGGGVALVNLSEDYSSSSPSPLTSKQNGILGLIAVLISCFTSGFAGVYFELVLKGGTTVSVYLRNFHLAFWSLLLATGTIVCYDMAKVKEMGFFQGFDGVVVLVILFQALTGLVVSLMIHFADTILKGFAISVAVVVATVASVFIFDTKIGRLFYTGAAMVAVAIRLYSSNNSSNTK